MLWFISIANVVERPEVSGSHDKTMSYSWFIWTNELKCLQADVWDSFIVTGNAPVVASQGDHTTWKPGFTCFFTQRCNIGLFSSINKYFYRQCESSLSYLSDSDDEKSGDVF